MVFERENKGFCWTEKMIEISMIEKQQLCDEVQITSAEEQES
jgi:hypothetical protein